MPDLVVTVSNKQSSSFSTIICSCLVIKPLKIFLRNKQIFISIFALLTLPLSLLLFSLSLSSQSIKSQILHLESLAAVSSTRFEARHVWRESRETAVCLLRLKLIYFVPSFILSLLAAVSAVVSAESGYNKNPISLDSVLNAVKSAWIRPLATVVFVYVILFIYSSLLHALWILTGGGDGSRSGSIIWIIGSGCEVYLMAMLGMGLVVSILESRFGLDAIRFGSDLMEGRRVCGWVLSGLLYLVTGLIGWEMERLEMDGEDLMNELRWTVVMVLKGWERLGLIVLYAGVVIWGFVVTTVFYCECRRQHVVGEPEEETADI